MRDYNKAAEAWLERVRALEPRSANDVPEELQQEFVKLMFLSDVFLRDIFGDTREDMEQLLFTCLPERVIYDGAGAPMTVTSYETDRWFKSPVTGVKACAPLYAEDDRNRCFAFQYCDWRGPNIRTGAAIFDTLHEDARRKGLPEKDFPEVYLIYLTDYDLTRSGIPIVSMDWDPDIDRHLSDEEWIARGCDPAQPDPLFEKWHMILFNACCQPKEEKT